MKFSRFSSLIIIPLLFLSGCGNPFMQKILNNQSSAVFSAIALYRAGTAYTGNPGSGVLGDPFIVHDIDTLERVGKGEGVTDDKDPSYGWNLNAHYLQISNIILKKEWEPIGSSSKPFTGVYDGGNKTISYLIVKANSGTKHGMFRHIDLNSTVKNIKLLYTDITTDDDHVGAIAGYNDGEVLNCSVSGSIFGYRYVGGLAGVNSGTVSNNCTFSGSVSGNNCVGGIAGDNIGVITECNSFGLVEGISAGSYSSNSIGGLAGSNNGRIENCSSTAEVKAGINDSFQIGGVVGSNTNIVTDCNSSGRVTGNGEVGGIVGLNKNNGNVTECYATGNIEGGEKVGGVVGNNDGAAVYKCHAKGNVSGYICVGGVAGCFVGSTLNSKLQECFYDNITGIIKGRLTVGGVIGENCATVENCYAIGNIEADEHAGGVVGLNRYGTITKCHASGKVEGKGLNRNAIGGVVGYNEGNLTNAIVEKCYSTCSVSGNDYIGGVAGQITNGSRVENCYATGSVSGNISVGGLVGLITDGGSVEKCYATGRVSGNNQIGGLAGSTIVYGSNIGLINYCAALNSAITATAFPADIGRVLGKRETLAFLSNNYANSNMKVVHGLNGVNETNKYFTGTTNHNDENGANTDAGDAGNQYNSETFWRFIMQFAVSSDWEMGSTNLPILIGVDGVQKPMIEIYN